MSTGGETLYSTSGMARFAECSEATVRRAERAGIVQAKRDTSRRRLFSRAEAEKLRAHVLRQRAAHGVIA